MGVRFDACELDLDRFELRRNGEPVALEPQAMKILIELLNHRGRGRRQDRAARLRVGRSVRGRVSLTTQIKELRRAVGDTGRDQRVVKTVHGRGYMFVAPVEDDDDEPLSSLGSDTEPDNPVVAVLSFANLITEPGHEHMAEGLTHDVISALSKHRWLRVLAKATTAGYAGTPDATARLRADLEVDYVVEGTVQLSNQRLA